MRTLVKRTGEDITVLDAVHKGRVAGVYLTAAASSAGEEMLPQDRIGFKYNTLKAGEKVHHTGERGTGI